MRRGQKFCPTIVSRTVRSHIKGPISLLSGNYFRSFACLLAVCGFFIAFGFALVCFFAGFDRFRVFLAVGFFLGFLAGGFVSSTLRLTDTFGILGEWF